MTRKLQVLFLFLFVIFSLNLFDAQFLNTTAVNYLVYIFHILGIVLSIPYLMSRPVGFVLPVQLIVLSILISIPLASFSWDQGVYHTIIVTIPYMTWFLFFYLIRKNFQVKTIEKIILFYGVVYVILYLFQFINAPTVFFGKSLWGDEFPVDRGITRIVFPGTGIFILAVFISINKLTTESKGKLYWLAFSIIGIVIPVLQVTRQFIAGILLIYLFHFLMSQNAIRKILLVACTSFAFLYITSSDFVIFKGIAVSAKEDLGQGEEYIRVLAGRYFINDFSPTEMNMILGNGAPYWGISPYGKFIEELAETQGFYLSDVGIVGMYAMFGVLSVIGYILIWIKSFTYAVPKEFYYLKYYLWYLLLTSFTWFTVYHHHYLISTVFVLYLYQKVYQETYKRSYHKSTSRMMYPVNV